MIPSLSICVTNNCNLDCTYCARNNHKYGRGENPLPTKALLKDEAFSNIVEDAFSVGIRVFRITGGEPFLVPGRIFAIMNKLNDQEGRSQVIINTNGTIVSEQMIINLFSYKNIDIKFKVSLDILEPEKYRDFCGKSMVDRVINCIENASRVGLIVEVNCVVTKHNVNDISSIWDFCCNNRISLKLLDLYKRDLRYWRDNYQQLSNLVYQIDGLGSRSSKMLSSDRGIPMLQYSSITCPASLLTIKDMSFGTTYIRQCLNCKEYPCGEGVFTILVDEDGRFFICHRSQRAILTYQAGQTGFKKELRNILKIYDDSTFFSKGWKQ